MVKKKIVFMLLLVSYIVFASGCVDESDAKDPKLLSEEIAANMQEKENSVNDSSYTLYMTTYSEGEKTSESEFEVMYKKPNMKKTITKGAENESIMIYDGKIEWLYDPETNIVQKLTIPEESQSEIDYFKLFNDILNEYNVSLLGNDTIDGRNTYLLEAKPKETEGTDKKIDKIRIWADEETWLPLKYEVYQNTQRIEIEIQNLKINTGIPDTEFVFDVPEGAEVVEMDFEDLLNKSMPDKEIKLPAEAGKETTMSVII